MLQKSRSMASRFAFAAMLCRRRGDSTWDRPDGEGSELGAIAHGHALGLMHSALDSVLLHVAAPSCGCTELEHPTIVRRAYTRVIRLEGETQLEQAVFARMRYQPHLWLKLLVLNLTEYTRVIMSRATHAAPTRCVFHVPSGPPTALNRACAQVMWLGLDTMPLSDLSSAFTHRDRCNPARAPCIGSNRNADTMLFKPDEALLVRMIREIAGSNASVARWDGANGYDQTYLTTRYELGPLAVWQLVGTPLANRHGEVCMSLGHGKSACQRPAAPHVYHFSGAAKPWYAAEPRTEIPVHSVHSAPLQLLHCACAIGTRPTASRCPRTRGCRWDPATRRSTASTGARRRR